MRLGKGGGFFDRLLEKYPKVVSATLIYELQLAEDLPQEPHDKVVDYGITEKKCVFYLKKSSFAISTGFGILVFVYSF